eukprot:c25244_g1_i1 orf=379-1620(-)
MELLRSVPSWQVVALSAMLFWLFLARLSLVTLRIRASVRPTVLRHVEDGVHFVLRLQSMQHFFLDSLFALVSFLVSLEFYTIFLPFLFWTGHCRLARQMTLLMASCVYVGNCLKDTISAPRPPSPPVRRLTATESERDFAMEYGLPSSHTVNTICLLGYLLLYLMEGFDLSTFWLVTFFSTLLALVSFGRLYLGMHSPIDILGGVFVGCSVLGFWCLIDEPLDFFITQGNNVLPFWVSLSFILLFAYPMPEMPTPSFEFHTAFNGVVLGVVWGVHRTYWQYHHENMVRLTGIGFGAEQIIKRHLVGVPLILAAKFISRELAKQLLPALCSLAGMPLKSSSYISFLQGQDFNRKLASNSNTVPGIRKLGHVPWPFINTLDGSYDVDTGIRMLQYAGLGWSVVELAPRIYELMGI